MRRTARFFFASLVLAAPLAGCSTLLADLPATTALLSGGKTDMPNPAVDAAEQYLKGLLSAGSLSPNQTKILCDTLEEVRAAVAGNHGTTAHLLVEAYKAEIDELVGRAIMTRDQANTAEKDLG